MYRADKEGTEMRKKEKCVVRLTEEERARLRTLIGRGIAPVRALSRARILLKTNPRGKADRAGRTRPYQRLWR